MARSPRRSNKIASSSGVNFRDAHSLEPVKKLESAALAHRVACLFGLACVARAGQPSEGRQPAEGSPQGDAKHRQHRCGYSRRPHALAKPRIQQQRGTL